MTTEPSTTTTTIGPTLARFRERIEGSVITAVDPGYDEARTVINLAFDRRPYAIVRVATAADVAESVRFATARSLPLTVRSGGHSVVGFSIADDAVVVDFSAYKSVVIDPLAQTAKVQAGATTEDVIVPANAAGLALSTGDTKTVGIGGLATGGGIGWLVRKYGLTADSLISAQVVLADGTLVSASATENADLFWGLRGGGGNFGIVTEFEFRLAPVRDIYGGALVLPATHDVLRGVLDYAAAAPKELSLIADLMYAPPAPFIPEERLGEPVVMVLAVWCGDLAESEQALAPLRALAEPVADALGPMAYPDIYLFTAPMEVDHLVVVRSLFSDAVSDQAIDDALESLSSATAPESMISFRAINGAISDLAAGETAFGHRDTTYFTSVFALWFDPSEDATPYKAWAEAVWEKIRHDGRGAYVNFLQDEGEQRLRDAYPGDTFDRLVALKRKHDPTNVFSHNQNIRP